MQLLQRLRWCRIGVGAGVMECCTAVWLLQQLLMLLMMLLLLSHDTLEQMILANENENCQQRKK